MERIIGVLLTFDYCRHIARNLRVRKPNCLLSWELGTDMTDIVSTRLMEMMPGRRANQSDALFETLTAGIMSGRIQPGEKLNEPALAETFGVSRAPVREALRRLQEKGLVTHVAHYGVRVISPSLEDFLALLDVREALEGIASRLAAVQMSQDELDELSAIVDEHGHALQRNPEGPYVQNDFDNDFHVRIARGCRNPVLTELLCDQFYPRLKLCRSRHGLVKGRGLAAWKEHRRILAALCERDGDVAELLMRRHVRSARQALLSANAEGFGGRPDHEGGDGRAGRGRKASGEGSHGRHG